MSKTLAIAAIAVGTAVVATIAYNTGLVVQHNRDVQAVKDSTKDIFDAFLKDKAHAN